jgi:hypothetical protein
VDPRESRRAHWRAALSPKDREILAEQEAAVRSRLDQDRVARRGHIDGCLDRAELRRPVVVDGDHVSEQGEHDEHAGEHGGPPRARTTLIRAARSALVRRSLSPFP